MRKLWEDHITWTRLAVISLDDRSARHDRDGQPPAPQPDGHRKRDQALLRQAAGNALTGLLRQHILIAADLIKAAKAGDQDAVAAQQARWVANADAIAAFLSKANPNYWKPAKMKAMMHSHLAAHHGTKCWRGCTVTGRPTSRHTTASMFRSSTWRTCSRAASKKQFPARFR